VVDESIYGNSPAITTIQDIEDMTPTEFRMAGELSVEELLALAEKKIKARQEE
jgi:hypothetical protein